MIQLYAIELPAINVVACLNDSPVWKRSTNDSDSVGAEGNPNNPDPSKQIIWGRQSRDEMMIGFFTGVGAVEHPPLAGFA